MSQVNVSDHIASLERFLGPLQCLDVNALSSALFPSSFTSTSSDCCASAASSSSSFGLSASETSVNLAGSMESEMKQTLVSAFYQCLTARKYCSDIIGATRRSDIVSLTRLQSFAQFAEGKLAELGHLMDRLFVEHRNVETSDSSTLVSDAELALVTPDQQQLFESQVQRLPAFVRNLLVQHQGACVPITVTLKDDNDQMRFVTPVSIKNTLYGKIIRAKESASEEQVAIKLSSWETFLQRRLAENFMREARMNQLIQPVPASIVGVREVGCDREHHWTVMEYVDGGDLFDRIVSEHGVSEAEAWLWMHQGAEAIRHLHSRRVAHCDISAENFMVTADGNLKLCDMGQARLFSVAEDESGELRELPFAVGTAFGTKLYCQPPEMLLKQPVHGTKLDVFSMGVTLYTMLQGCRPFQHGAWLHDAEYGRCAQGLASQIALNARMQCMANQARPDPRCHLDPHCTFCASSEAAEAHASCRISAGAAEVIARMLCLPELRASIDEVLALPWMQQLPAATAADAEDVPQENSSQEGQLAHPAASSNAADNSKADAFAHSGNLSADASMQV